MSTLETEKAKRALANANEAVARLSEAEISATSTRSDIAAALLAKEAAQNSLEKVEQQRAKLISEVKSVKMQISEWKNWVTSVNPISRIAEQAKATAEVTRLGAQIVALESRISAMEVQRHAMIATLQVAAARHEGLTEDPEKANAVILSSLKSARRRAERRVERAEEKLKAKKPRGRKAKSKATKTDKARTTRRTTKRGGS